MLDRMGRGFLIKDPERRFGRVWMNGEVEVSVGTLCSRETTGIQPDLAAPPPPFVFPFFHSSPHYPSCLICFSSSSILTTYFSAGHSENAMGFSGSGFLICVSWSSPFSRRPFLRIDCLTTRRRQGGCLGEGDDAHVIEACSSFSFSVCRLFTTTQPSRTYRIDNNTHAQHIPGVCVSHLSTGNTRLSFFFPAARHRISHLIILSTTTTTLHHHLAQNHPLLFISFVKQSERKRKKR